MASRPGREGSKSGVVRATESRAKYSVHVRISDEPALSGQLCIDAKRLKLQGDCVSVSRVT